MHNFMEMIRYTEEMVKFKFPVEYINFVYYAHLNDYDYPKRAVGKFDYIDRIKRITMNWQNNTQSLIDVISATLFMRNRMDIHNIIPFAGNGCGDDFVFRIHKNGGFRDIAYWYHETHDQIRICDNFLEFILKLNYY